MPKILHIEDDPANRLLVRKLLSPAGFEVIDAVDGLEGIRLACIHHPDLVLVDIAIPGLDGYEVTLRLRNVLLRDLDYEQAFRITVRIVGDGVVLAEQTLRIVVPAVSPEGAGDAGPADAGPLDGGVSGDGGP